jgi:hypothetical protein
MRTYFKTITLIFLFFCTLGISPFLDAAKTPAIYFQHEGDSDKPISPMVIAVEEPDEKELTEILGPDDWELRLFFAVSAKDLEKIIKVLQPYLTTKTEKESGYKFGTFEITLVESGSTQSKIFSRPEFKKILEILYPLISEDYESLREYFETLKKRLN